MDLDFAPIDADNHYYETLDAFTRHLDPKFKQRGVQVGAATARTRSSLIGGQGQPVHPEPDVRPDHRARLPRPACSAARSPRASTRAR